MHHLEMEEQERREAAIMRRIEQASDKRNHLGHPLADKFSVGPAVDETAVDWSQAPEWANYWAMDGDGDAYWYLSHPDIGSQLWLSADGDFGLGGVKPAPDFGGAAIDWQDSLVARPAAIKDCFTTADTVDHPAHYANQGGIECIEVLEQLAADGHDFRILNAIKYLWRYRHKGGDESLRKARWYIERVLGES